MNYLTIEFSVFFLGFFIIYWLCSAKPGLQNLLLLIFSYAVLCLFNYYFAVAIFIYTLVIYLLSKRIAKSKKKRFWFILAILLAVINFTILKYFDFFAENLQSVFIYLNLNSLIASADVIMPLGLSFYTFHSMSYLVAVKKKELTKINFFNLSLYLSFFPSVIAGPINRVHDFLPQITTNERRDILEPYKAFTLIIFALIKVYWLSAFISETWVNPMFANPSQYHAIDLIFNMYAYGIQLYLNFSGYTDLVTAIAFLLGFKLPVNFNFPYLATNLKDFWNRWHMSLSLWIRDFIYIPLGGGKKGLLRTQLNLIIAMLFSALWHGITLNFIIWGALHAAGIIIYNLWRSLINWQQWHFQERKFAARLITLTYVCFAWIFFKTSNLSESFEYLSAIANNFEMPELTYNSLFYLLIMFAFYFVYPLFINLQNGIIYVMRHVHWIFLPFLLILFLWLIIHLAPSGIPNFIYAGF